MTAAAAVQINMFGWLLLCLLTAAAALLAALSRPSSQASALRDWGARVLFVIAHPDDEAMFFVPTIRALVERQPARPRQQQQLTGADDISATEVHVLCLSSGNYDGLGATRTRELQAAARVLGVTRAQTIEHAQLQDGPRSPWPAEVVAAHVAAYVKAHNIQTV
jgi:N-acetylglucosaminylphosphatidylinositol deacetylase